MEEAEGHAKGRAQRWLVDRLCEVSPTPYTIQRVHNWKSRGIPRGEYPTLALALGKTIDWVAGAEHVNRRGTDSTSPPPAPRADFSDRREATESGWSVLEDLAAMPERERAALVADIRARAESYRAYLREAMQRMRAAAAAPGTERYRGDDPQRALQAAESDADPVASPPVTDGLRIASHGPEPIGQIGRDMNEEIRRLRALNTAKRAKKDSKGGQR